jgi:hypothetical protein
MCILLEKLALKAKILMRQREKGTFYPFHYFRLFTCRRLSPYCQERGHQEGVRSQGRKAEVMWEGRSEVARHV